MNKRIYAKPGTGFQAVFVDNPNPDVPDGFVEMSEDRPADNSICRNNFDGTGEWIARKPSIKEKLSKLWGRVNYNTYQWVSLALWDPKYLRYCWLANKEYSIFRVRFISDFVFGMDHRKSVDFFCLIIPLIIIFCFELESGVYYDLLMATSAAAIFDVFITILPREQAKRKNAEEIHRILYQIVLLKNFQYQMIGYLPDRFFVPESEWVPDKGMDRGKANKLMRLINESENSKYLGSLPQLPFEMDDAGTIRDFLIKANAYYFESLNKLVGVVSSEYFPGFYAATSSVRDSLNKIIRFPEYRGSSEYVSTHFRFIESLQLHYNVECYRYSRLGFDTYMVFDGQSIKEVIHVGLWYYADVDHEIK